MEVYVYCNEKNSGKDLFWSHYFKGSQLGAICPYAIVYCYNEFKLRYLKNLKLFSIKVKELFEPLFLQKKKNK